jgi:(methylthio)acryloyl-CoA hydratase
MDYPNHPLCVERRASKLLLQLKYSGSDRVSRCVLRVITEHSDVNLVNTFNHSAGVTMPSTFTAVTGVLAQLDLLRIEQRGAVLHLRLMRPAKRNAINDALVAQLHTAFVNLPEGVRAVVISGEGDHFCAGLDLSELGERSVAEGIVHSRSWHAAFDQIQFGRVPVIAVLHGAVVGGGLELASSAHVRVAEASTFYGLPEGPRGLFVGLSQYVVEDGKGLEKALALAEKVAANAPLSNFAVMHALPRIADMNQSDGLFTESLMAAIAQGDDAAKSRMRAFLEGKAGKVAKS